MKYKILKFFIYILAFNCYSQNKIKETFTLITKTFIEEETKLRDLNKQDVFVLFSITSDVPIDRNCFILNLTMYDKSQMNTIKSDSLFKFENTTVFVNLPKSGEKFLDKEKFLFEKNISGDTISSIKDTNGIKKIIEPITQRMFCFNKNNELSYFTKFNDEKIFYNQILKDKIKIYRFFSHTSLFDPYGTNYERKLHKKKKKIRK